jgi:hypothetical protein
MDVSRVQTIGGTMDEPGNYARFYGIQGIAPQPLPVQNEVTIRKVANGFTLQFGCQTFVAKTWKEASEGLAEYWKDPEAARKKYTL